MLERVHQSAENDFGLQTGQGRTQAEMDTVTEGQMTTGIPVQIEPVGVRVTLRIVIG